ncbi:Leucine Rich repeat [Lentzea albidocapillata subsp. violacea]|uniref:Leucine Rich repeat n=1 Tax=Lentzea albidocapillata subsp. violacea TaxID=128104 RepID=A0A1G9XDZ5_9PSEU|nr:hypothetical protein [Lentzea albidocapillata]SDM94944.1 Leucine Rich repeat [Lentzea albidocapillata subsp. violacea]
MNEEIARTLRGTPSLLAFRALCAAVTRSGEDLLAWCEEQLASWPDDTRQAPYSWIAALQSGFTKPVWPLVRSLDLGSGVRQGMRELELPDPRTCAEVRAVTGLKFARYGQHQVAAFAETADHWQNLRSVEFAGLWEVDEAPMARFAASEAVSRLESLTVVRVWESLWGLDHPPLRIERPTRLKHAGLLAADLIHLLRNGFAPDLTSVTVLVRSVDEARELAGFDGLAALDRLEIGFRCGKKANEQDEIASEEFFSHAQLTNLRSLTVHGSHMNRGGARGLTAAGGVLGQLTELSLAELPGGDDVIARVLGATEAAIIEKLTLTGLVATDRIADAFAAEYPRLRHLGLRGNYLGPDGARRLLAARMPALEHLDFGCAIGSPHYSRVRPQPLGDAGAQAAARHKGLKRVNLSATGLTPAGLRPVLELPLEFLDVSGNPLGDLPQLPDAPAWRTLRTLVLDDCAFGDPALLPPNVPHLESVSLAHNNIGSDGARALAGWAVLPQLWELNLHENVIGDDGLVDLARSRAAQRLLELDLEQDVWTAHHRRDSVPLPAEVVAPESFPNLDALYLGVVDDYHGHRSSCGFPRDQLEELIRTGRPELAAFLSHVDLIRYLSGENEDWDPPTKDYRSERLTRYAEAFAAAEEFARKVVSGDPRGRP